MQRAQSRHEGPRSPGGPGSGGRRRAPATLLNAVPPLNTTSGGPAAASAAWLSASLSADPERPALPTAWASARAWSAPSGACSEAPAALPLAVKPSVLPARAELHFQRDCTDGGCAGGQSRPGAVQQGRPGLSDTQVKGVRQRWPAHRKGRCNHLRGSAPALTRRKPCPLACPFSAAAAALHCAQARDAARTALAK